MSFVLQMEQLCLHQMLQAYLQLSLRDVASMLHLTTAPSSREHVLETLSALATRCARWSLISVGSSCPLHTLTFGTKCISALHVACRGHAVAKAVLQRATAAESMDAQISFKA